MVKRITINVNDLLYEKIQKIRADIIRSLRKNVSFAAVFNAVAFGGLLAADKFTEADWKLIYSFIKEFVRSEKAKRLPEKKFAKNIIEVEKRIQMMIKVKQIVRE